MIPAGGVYSTLHDMAKYLQFHINKGVVNGQRILRADLMEEMHTIQFPCPRQRCGYCMALLRDPVSSSYNIYHSGSGYGFSGDMVMYPELKLGVIVLFNSSANEFTGWPIRHDIDNCVVAQNGETPVDKPGIERMIKLNQDNPRIQAILGHFGDSREGELTIERADSIVGLRVSPEQFYKLEFYDDNGELVGMLGRVSEVRFLPPYFDRRGAMYIVDRRLSNGATFNICDFNYAFDEPPGPDKPEWSRYLGKYEVLKYGVPYRYTANITVKNGYLYYNDCKCMEYEPGLFFRYDGDALDFRFEPPTFGNIVLRKK
jgi:hypothetical protein